MVDETLRQNMANMTTPTIKFIVVNAIHVMNMDTSLIQ
jgi:hypothetical protein